jgi:lysophospholipase L1-like esterase
MLRFQLCITNGDETYEKHSPIFSGIVDKSLSHNGEEAEIDVIPLFDPYKKYVDELILDAGARVVDTELDETSDHLVENQAVAKAVANVNGRLGVQNVSFTPIDGKYITNRGNDSTSNNFARSNAIEVSAGTIIEFTATGYLVNAAMIAVTDANETTFTPVSISIDSEEHTYSYTASEDCYVVVSYLKSKPYRLFFATKWSNTALNDRVTVIESENVPLMSDAIGIDVVADNVSITVGTAGKYVNNSGTLSSSGNLNLSTEITLKKGQTITFNAIGYLTSVALLAMVNGSGAARPYTPIIVSVDSVEHTNSYTATIDMTVVISSHKSITPKYTISTSNIQRVSADIINMQYGWVAFSTMGVIGDSLASGASNYPGGVTDRPAFSWGKFIEREHGITVNLFTAGGTTTRSWLTGSFGLNALNNADALDCYIIGLGVNDAYSLGDAYLGSVSDVHVGNEDENADTYYGNYSKIIAAIKTKSPRAKIFCITNPRGTDATGVAYNGAVEDIVGLYTNTYLIDLREDSFYASPEFKSTWYSAHSTAVGYKLIAKNIYNHLNDIIQKNVSDFLDIQWIVNNHN